ncbi:hypothetical protein FSP39_013295 [Pinctada imbricata]|uniref:CUB domain-containing protein n=1 Tax=Pinctada imbricata TaxID=66713 RepID=A0AA89BSS3_PINIB|nr:hypothetical protein FSP39_013295 [Pinctada imbricata]
MMRILEYSIFILLHSSYVTSDITTDYLTTPCSSLSASISDVKVTQRLQSSTALVYSNSMDCKYMVTVPSGYFVVAVFRRFELEPQDSSGTCLDYVNFHEGSSSGALLNSDPYCDKTNPGNATSAGNSMTLHFLTDSSAQYRGFDLLFTAAQNVPCSSTQYTCNTSICIDITLKCDGFNQCGDNSDESVCTAADFADDSSDNTVLIAGLCIGLGSAAIIGAIIGIYIYRQYRWRKFLRDPLPEIQKWDSGDTYPVTQKYYKHEYRNYNYSSIDSREPSRMSNDFDTDDELGGMDPTRKTASSPISSTSSKVKKNESEA